MASPFNKHLGDLLTRLGSGTSGEALAKRFEKWALTASPRQVIAVWGDLVAVYAATTMLDGGGDGEQKRMPVFLRGKLGPLEWITQYGTVEQKKELVAQGQLPESVLESEVVSEEPDERADA
jgi:hypothetical protein